MAQTSLTSKPSELFNTINVKSKYFFKDTATVSLNKWDIIPIPILNLSSTTWPVIQTRAQ